MLQVDEQLHRSSVNIATTTFKFSVNSPVNDPSMMKALDDVTGAETFNLTDYFTDTDVHDVLTYSLTVEDPNVVNATLVGSTLYVQNGLFRDGRSLVTVTASDGYTNVSDALNATYSFLTFSFSTGPSESDQTLTGISGTGWGAQNLVYFTTITRTSDSVEVPIGDSRYWMYTLLGYESCCPGYQFTYDSQEDEWSLFTKAEHPNGPGTDSNTVARSGGYLVVGQSGNTGDIWKGLDPFAT